MDEYSAGPGLAEVDREEVARFVGIANCPSDQAQFFLQATDGNFDRALALYFGTSTVCHHQGVPEDEP